MDSHPLFIHIVCKGLTAQDLTKGVLRGEKTFGAKDVRILALLHKHSVQAETEQSGT